MSRLLSVCVDYHPKVGGTFTTINSFRRYINNSIISFRIEQPEHSGSSPDVISVPVASGPLGRLYGVAPRARLEAAEELVAKSDVVCLHVLFRYAAQWAAAAARRHNKPLWVVTHGTLDPYVFTYRAWRKRIFMGTVGRTILQSASRIICSTNAELRKASRWLPRGSKTSVVHWPVEIKDSPLREASRGFIAQALRIAPDTRLLVWVGRLHPMKRPLEAAQAFAAAAPRRTALLMVGPDQAYTREECASYCVRNSIQGVHWLGGVFGEEKERLFQAADGFLSISLRENFGYTTADALAYGRPVLLTPGNDLSADISAVGCGWFGADDSMEQVVQMLRDFDDADSLELARMGKCGQEWARENLSVDNFVQTVNRFAEEDLAARQQR